MKSTPFLIALAAFAVTATGVQAFSSPQMLEKAGLSEKQISAFEVARELKVAGNLKGARDVLIEAGVDENVLKSVHKIAHAKHAKMHSHGGMKMKMKEKLHTLSNEQRDALAVARQANNKKAVKAIFKEAGIVEIEKGERRM